MQTWQITFIAIFGIAFLVVLGMVLWFITFLLIINFIILNLDTVLTNRPARMALTSGQAIAEAGWRR